MATDAIIVFSELRDTECPMRISEATGPTPVPPRLQSGGIPFLPLPAGGSLRTLHVKGVVRGRRAVSQPRKRSFLASCSVSSRWQWLSFGSCWRSSPHRHELPLLQHSHALPAPHINQNRSYGLWVSSSRPVLAPPTHDFDISPPPGGTPTRRKVRAKGFFCNGTSSYLTLTIYKHRSGRTDSATIGEYQA